MALGNEKMLIGFKKEIDIALHFRKVTFGKEECGFKTRDRTRGRKAHYEFLEKQEVMRFKLVNPFPNVPRTNFNISKYSVEFKSTMLSCVPARKYKERLTQGPYPLSETEVGTD